MADIMRPMPAVPLESPTKLCPSSPPSPPCLVASRNREAKAKSSCVRCAGSRTNRRKISARSAKSNENIQNKYVREREKKGVLCAWEGHGQAGWWVCVAGTVPLSCHSPYYCAAVITLLGFQLKSNCPPFDWNQYCTNGYKSSEFRSHETVVGTIMMFRNM